MKYLMELTFLIRSKCFFQHSYFLFKGSDAFFSLIIGIDIPRQNKLVKVADYDIGEKSTSLLDGEKKFRYQKEVGENIKQLNTVK